ncbi:leucine-rich repeat protein [bacterium]|nr:leucine-rich repeat protein [bacterium]
MNLLKKAAILIFSVLIANVFSVPIKENSPVLESTGLSHLASEQNTIRNISSLKNLFETNIEQYFNQELVYKLPDTVKDDDMISVIIEMDFDSLYDKYLESGSCGNFSDYVTTKTASKQVEQINELKYKKIRELDALGVKYTLGEEYNTLLAGFEIEIKAKDYDSISNLFPNDTLIIGEVYEKQETEVVENYVNVYDTGIFDSSEIEYQGDGVVVAVLDTGLDYTHSAFSVENFTTTNEAFTLSYVSSKINQTLASTFTEGLTGEDVYVSKKIPYAYDYADKDPDVSPINSEHGTHVAGIIAGKDSEITGVAPNAQLAIFKVFSDHSDGAKTSWIIAALEDCVVLGVDLINMSLGTSCGFSREVDKEYVNTIYDKIKDAGIEMIASAGNQYNSTMGSEKNGNNGLTSNPDYGTVGSPSTYEATLSVASVEGLKTSYLKHNDTIIYFNEAFTNSADVTKSFVDDILKTLGNNVNSHIFEYVVIPGIGRSSDYPDEDSFYEGKIVLVKRGITTFEDKVRIALKEKGAAGIIIYNNVSGSISMSVGANIGAVCSLSQDDGEYLVSQVDPKTGIGKIEISRSLLAGPFMSDFSSWGPTSDLKIKPEITAHGGQIYSAIPGQSYDRLSGTSMSAPNLSGVTALVCQYVKYSGVFGTNLSTKEVTDIVNQLMMSTSDIIYDKNGLPSFVRKQGSGLVSLDKSVTSEAYLSTYDKNNEKMSKAKFELGDDKNKTGVYSMTFDINNITSSSISYDISSIVLTEGVNVTYTSHSDTTVTQKAYELKGATITVDSVTNGTQNGNKVEVGANQVAKVKVTVTLSDSDKEYLNNSFKNGMYVEGYIKLKTSGSNKTDLNLPYLAFYGDWTQAPIFDEEYYDTNVDEINKGLDPEDKLMPDAYATRVIGGLYSDYITTLGTYYFTQDPNATQIAASKEHIAISNQDKGEENGSTVSSIRSVNAGLLRNAKEIYIEIKEESTGKTIYTDLVTNQHKTYSYGSSFYGTQVDIKYNILEQNLKNNTKYTCTLTAYIDYGEKEDQKNLRNTFSFPFYVDFEAPIITDVAFRSEYDKTSKETHLYADLSVYDNHYAMGIQLGQIIEAEEGSEYTFSLQSFGKYVTPVYSSFNSTSIVTIELTNYVSQLKNSCGIEYNPDYTTTVIHNTNTFVATVYDYGMNYATYEISLPDDIIYMYFENTDVNLSPNETLDLTKALNIYPSSSWIQVLNFTSSNPNVVSIVNSTLIAKESGISNITASGKDKDGNPISATMNVRVLNEGDEGYVGGYSIPEINRFSIDGYKTVKAYYNVTTEERDIGMDDGEYDFGDTITLKMYPSETVDILYTLDSYFPEKTTVEFKSSNSKIATVDENGRIIAQAKGNTTIMINVLFDGASTFYLGKISIEVKDPFNIQSIYLYNYKGLGGEVIIPGDRGITTIYNYAFSNYEFVEKDLEAGDVIDDEDPYLIKQHYIGDDTITKVVIPEGVTTISEYAFANLTALEEVVLPSTLIRIGVGAFYNCTSLKKINLEHAKFINEKAFYNCPIEDIDLSSVVSIGNYAFENCRLNYVTLPSCAQSLSEGAFYNNEYLTSVTLRAKKIKIAPYVFAKCSRLVSININASVISSHAFEDCVELSDVTIGQDVSIISEYAFANTAVANFKLNSRNPYLTLEENGALILKGTELILAAPSYIGASNTITSNALSIASGAFSGNKKVFYLVLNNVKNVGDYAFANCVNLKTVTMPNVETIGKYAFYETDLTDIGLLANLKSIGNYAFAGTDLETLTLTNNVTVGDYAFAYCDYLETVTLGNNVTIGSYAFFNPITFYTYDQTENFEHYTPYAYEVKDKEGNTIKTNSYYRYNFIDGVKSKLTSLTAGSNLSIGEAAFFGNGKLQTVTLGDGTKVGDYAFYSCHALTTIDLSKVKTIGRYAFSGYTTYDYYLENNIWRYAYESEYDDGAFISTAYVYTCFSPSFTSANLTNTEEVLEGAFSGNSSLTNVILSDYMNVVGKEMFANCKSLTEINLKPNITEIGEQAFSSSGITTINLEGVDTIGEAAFFNTPVNNITFKDDVVIGDSAFYYAEKLSNVLNTAKIKLIGDLAFALTSIESIDLSNATSIGDFAFGKSALRSVALGEKLVELGENPFFGSLITTFAKTKDIIFNSEVVGTESVETYDLSPTVKVVDGVLYEVVPKGYELVSYPRLKADKEFTIDENTVRISSLAFAESNIEKVILSNILISIGDKAFYGCEKLNAVIFRSYDAPLLEEEFNTNYITENNLPITGNIGEVSGLSISKYYMWNVFTNYTNFYYGANFKDYIGHNTGDLIMVRPKNGQNYDSFIFDQYFSTKVDGVYAPTINTLNIITQIDNLPVNVTLNDEAQIVAARQAYDSLTSEEQKSLISNYENLVRAESTLAYLKSREETPVDPTDPTEPTEPSKFAIFMKNNMYGFILSGIIAIGFTVALVLVIKKKKRV